MKITGLNDALKSLVVDVSKIKDVLVSEGEYILNSTKSSISIKDYFVADSYNMRVEKTDTGWVVNVGSDIEMAAYYEFGTGEFVVVPPETTDAYTMQWWKGGKGTLDKHPSLYPAYRIVALRLSDRIKEGMR